jgi:hypothetical protein
LIVSEGDQSWFTDDEEEELCSSRQRISPSPNIIFGNEMCQTWSKQLEDEGILGNEMCQTWSKQLEDEGTVYRVSSLCISEHIHLCYRNPLIDFWCFNATFSNILAISWQPDLVVEEAGERTTNHGQVTGILYHLGLRVECTLFCNLQSRVQTHAVLVIGLYGLLGNPST